MATLAEKSAELERLLKSPEFSLLPPRIQAKKINAWIKTSGFDELLAQNDCHLPNRISIPSLRVIWNVFNDCQSFALELGDCPLLEEICIQSNNTPLALSHDIGKLANLKEIRLYRSKNLPESLALCTKLATLALDYIDSETVPLPIKELTQLQTLTIGNKLDSIPDWIQNLTQLTTLHLRGKITSISESTINFMNGIDGCKWDRTAYEIHQVVGKVPNFQKDFTHLIVDYLQAP